MPNMHRVRHALFALLITVFATPSPAEPVVIADFAQPAEAQAWRMFTDQVMGGVSEGRATVDDGALVLTGTVSTANNGGFIQARRDGVQLAPDTQSITARVRGDGQTYYLHLRTRQTRLPWQYYQAAFTAPNAWTTVTIPLSDFKPSGRMMTGIPHADDVRSIALVAFGRDHVASVALSALLAE